MATRKDTVTMLERYQMKAVIFDILAECKELKENLLENGITVMAPFFGLQIEATIKEVVKEIGITEKDCLLITNNNQHAKIALQLGMAVAGCMEGHYEVPQTVTLLEAPEEVSVNYLNQIYCHRIKCPAVIAETERCFLKELSKDDMDALYDILTDEEVARFLPAKVGDREEELEKLISYVSHVYSFFEYGYWGIFSKKNGELIGRAGFKEGSYPLEAGYVIKRSEWGKGLATEILQELIQYASEELGCSELIVKIDERNTASVRVAEKNGFSDTGETEQLGETEKLSEISGQESMIRIYRRFM